MDARLGTWEDVRTLSNAVELIADLIVNHVSSSSPQFLDFSRKGSASQYSGMFLTFDRVFPRGACESDLLGIYRPRPSLPFSPVTLRMREGAGCQDTLSCSPEKSALYHALLRSLSAHKRQESCAR